MLVDVLPDNSSNYVMIRRLGWILPIEDRTYLTSFSSVVLALHLVCPLAQACETLIAFNYFVVIFK